MKRRLFLILLVVMLAPVRVHAAGASWLIDPARFHVSAHGQVSCLDCHEGLGDDELHPDPRNVGKLPVGFIPAEACLSCHDDMEADLRAGRHGGQRAGDKAPFVNCLPCHNPHYQLRLEDLDSGRVSPERPPRAQCGVCHEAQSKLPELFAEDEACMACHGLAPTGNGRGRKRIAGLCFHCHGEGETEARLITGRTVSLINEEIYEETPHADMACTLCHPDAASYGHTNQTRGDCRKCHLPHDAKKAHEVHAHVSCEACHLGGIRPVRDPVSKQVLWERVHRPGGPSRVHHMILGGGEPSCRRCHFQGNRLGASTMILPPKSILCMPCHAATFSVGDTTTVLSLVIFLFGMVMLCSLWLSGSVTGRPRAGLFSKCTTLLWGLSKVVLSYRIFLVLRALILDVVLQRRLLKQSAARWCIHSLIFLPFVFRFTWGLAALMASLWMPEWTWPWVMLDKNHPVTAFLFDLTGAMVILGICAALIRGIAKRSERPPGFPRQDYLAFSLIFGVVMIGFILEGMRMAMTGAPGSASYAFVGYAVSRAFSDIALLADAYGIVWYYHAVLTGVFVAYLPFSRMRHILLAPIVLIMNAVSEYEHRGQQ